MLHIINQSPFESFSLNSCLDVIQAGDVILLIEDGVIAAAVSTIKFEFSKFGLYALKSDVIARGLLNQMQPEILVIGYEDFVDLTIKHHPICTWS